MKYLKKFELFKDDIKPCVKNKVISKQRKSIYVDGDIIKVESFDSDGDNIPSGVYKIMRVFWDDFCGDDDFSAIPAGYYYFITNIISDKTYGNVYEDDLEPFSEISQIEDIELYKNTNKFNV